MLKQVFNNPQVETYNSIQDFQSSLGAMPDYSFALKKIAPQIGIDLFKCFADGYYVFDSLGRELCYQGLATCPGTQFLELLRADSSFSNECFESSVSLSEVLSQVRSLDGTEVQLKDLRKSKYYFIKYWAKYFGGKKGYRENVSWMQDVLIQTKSHDSITFITINTDLQVSWGLVKGKKAKLILERNNDKASFHLKDIPFEKNNDLKK